MLATSRHGQKIPLTPGQMPDQCSDFAYLFPNAPTFPDAPDTLTAFEDLHKHMLDQPRPAQLDNSGIAPIFTYFGQFIDHDITAKSDPDDLIDIFKTDLKPASRLQVREGLANIRTGRLDLESLYGPDTLTGHAALDKLRSMLRFHGDRAMMWVARYDHLEGQDGVRFPEDRAGDLLRLGRLLNPLSFEAGSHFTADDIAALPDAHRRLFQDIETGTLNIHRAIIADPRNDENLFIAQLHLAFLRFHNRMVQAWPRDRRPGDEDEVHAWAREQVTLHYQWLVLNVYLPTICDKPTYRQILDRNCSLYASFVRLCRQQLGRDFPMPIEFSFAAFRFGHSMVRGSYDWNPFFGRGTDAIQPAASFDQMFAFTGNSRQPMPRPDGSSFNRLPDFWGPAWDRLVHPISAFADRAARPIDTRIAIPLTRMTNEITQVDNKDDSIQANLIARNLRSGYGHNIASAQSCIDALEARLGVQVRRLTKSQIASGPTGSVVRKAAFDEHTPLWFYILKEAEVLGNGEHLGPVGTHIVAGTVAGLIVHDPASCWNRRGSVEGRWHPVDGARASGQIVDSLPALIRAAGLM